MVLHRRRAGWYTAWMWLRLDRSAWWRAPGVASLIVFAAALTRVDTSLAGRAFAAYGGVYIVRSLVWLAVVERTTPRVLRRGRCGTLFAGAALILYR